MKSTFQQVCFATKQKLPTTLGILHAYAMQHGEGADGVHWIECIFVQKGGTLASACLDMASRPPKWNYTGSGRDVMQVNYQMCSLYFCGFWYRQLTAQKQKQKCDQAIQLFFIWKIKTNTHIYETHPTVLKNTPCSFVSGKNQSGNTHFTKPAVFVVAARQLMVEEGPDVPDTLLPPRRAGPSFVSLCYQLYYQHIHT